LSVGCALEAEAAEPVSAPTPLLPQLRRHAVFLGVLAAAVVVRAFFLATYRFPFFFPDSASYVNGTQLNTPDHVRPFGYSEFLKPFVPGHLTAAVVVQHLMAVGLLVLCYVFLVRRGLRPWLAALALIPLALDARQITLEHYVMTETLFLVLLTAALVVLACQRRPGLLAGLGGGLLLAGANLTRSAGLPVVALAVVYLLVRRAGWLPIVGLVLTLGAPLYAYASWYEEKNGVFALSESSGRFLYGRVMSVVDCGTLELEDWQKPLCVPLPPEKSQQPDEYIWNPDSPANKLYPLPQHDPMLMRFDTDVLKQQPGRYLVAVLREAGWHVVRPAMKSSPACLYQLWLPPRQPDFRGENQICQAQFYRPTATPADVPERGIEVAGTKTTILHHYGRIATTPGPFYPVAIVLALVAAVWRFRRPGWRDAADALLFTAAGVGLVVFAVATSMYDSRYVLPAVTLAPIGAAFAVHRLVQIRRPAPADESAG
jgi:4-amino-4-deoxy-L-arabinose transferase-like glycosyltransferase